MEEWEVENLITKSKLKKYRKNHEEDFVSVFANLMKVLDNLNDNITFEQIVQNFSYVRDEKKHVYRIGNKKRSNAHETRLYICVEKQQKIIYLLELGDKKSQQIDINNSHKQANRILL